MRPRWVTGEVGHDRDQHQLASRAVDDLVGVVSDRRHDLIERLPGGDAGVQALRRRAGVVTGLLVQRLADADRTRVDDAGDLVAVVAGTACGRAVDAVLIRQRERAVVGVVRAVGVQRVLLAEHVVLLGDAPGHDVVAGRERGDALDGGPSCRLDGGVVLAEQLGEEAGRDSCDGHRHRIVGCQVRRVLDRSRVAGLLVVVELLDGGVLRDTPVDRQLRRPRERGRIGGRLHRPLVLVPQSDVDRQRAHSEQYEHEDRDQHDRLSTLVASSRCHPTHPVVRPQRGQAPCPRTSESTRRPENCMTHAGICGHLDG